MFKDLAKLFKAGKYVRELIQYKKNCSYPAGHFYSPVVSLKEIKSMENEIWSNSTKEDIAGIDLQTREQIELLNKLSAYYGEIPFKADKQLSLRYYFENEYYSYTDGIVLYSMIRHFKPARIIEVGSGFSSAVMLDTSQLFFNNKIEMTFIEPFPERLFSLVSESDKAQVTIIQNGVQSVPVSAFEKLEAGDILFIDSSHVVKTGSDVHYILFEILPALKPGVIIHFHDVFYPFEYPKTWVMEGRNWNEDYFLKAFLMYNNNFRILLFPHYLHSLHKEAFNKMRLCYKNLGGNLWLEKRTGKI